MKKILLIFLVLGLVACGEDGPSDSDGQDGSNGGNGGVVTQSQWGELPCQKNLSCSNPVLNLDYQTLKDFIELRFPQNGSFGKNTAGNYFSCGRIFINQWFEFFPQHMNSGFFAVKEIADFGRTVMDIKKCTNQPDVTKQMQIYLTNTKEYKNGN